MDIGQEIIRFSVSPKAEDGEDYILGVKRRALKRQILELI
jgi:hypothetical protein